MKQIYNFGEILLELREKNGLTQKQLADRLGIKFSTVSKYETSSTPPPALMVRKIAATFGVTADYMLGLGASGTVSLIGLTEEQANIVTALVELYRTQNTSPKSFASDEKTQLLGRITRSFFEK